MQEEISNILKIVTQILNRMDKMEERQNTMEGRQDRVEERQDRMEGRLKRIEERQDRMEGRLKRMEERQDRMEKKQDAMQEELIKIGNTVTRMEYEHGQKLDLILEVLTGHSEQLQKQEERFEKDEKILEMHGNQIYWLEEENKKRSRKPIL